MMSVNIFMLRFWILTCCLVLISGCFGQREGGGIWSSITTPRPEVLIGWDITLTKILVEEAEERRSLLGIPVDDGDEPYFVMVGVKATLGTSQSTVFAENFYKDKDWAGHMKSGQQKTIPPAMGNIRFDNVSKRDVIGIVVVAAEADSTPWTMIEERVGILRQELTNIFVNSVEDRAAINVASNAFVNELHTSMQNAARLVASADDTGDSMRRRFYSLNNIDDVVGINTMLFMMTPPSERLVYPSYEGGYLTDVLNVQGADYRFYENALVFESLEKGTRYMAEVRIRPF